MTCNLCGSNKFVTKFNGVDRLYDLPGDFNVVKCTACGLMFVNPQPTRQSLIQHYPQTYWSPLVSNMPLKRAAVKLHELLVSTITSRTTVPQLTKGKLLDIGCGSGVYLKSMKEAGWDVHGVEPSAAACEYARRHKGLKIFNGTVEEAVFPNDFFDAITMHQVLEHVQNPKETLCEICRILKPDGLLALSIPDANSYESKMFGTAWYMWDLPRHLYHFSVATITTMLEKSGFWVVDLKHAANVDGILQSVRYVFEDAKLNPKLGLVLSYPFSFLMAIILAANNSSGSMAVYARKIES